MSFLAEWWFVVPWYLIGLAGAVWIVWDVYTLNTHVGEAMKWAWPIIAYFSVIGFAAYLATSRPPGIGGKRDDDAKKLYQEYADTELRRVTGSVIHCVAGDGLGIISAMVFARILAFSFWQEFWAEYLVGYLMGWFIFQYRAQLMMAANRWQALWFGGRAEFFSMLTVMAGMGVVMGAVTPLSVGEQPPPDTWAFWGFAALGLFAGYIATYPMNWMLLRIGWKHGM